MTVSEGLVLAGDYLRLRDKEQRTKTDAPRIRVALMRLFPPFIYYPAIFSRLGFCQISHPETDVSKSCRRNNPILTMILLHSIPLCLLGGSLFLILIFKILAYLNEARVCVLSSIMFLSSASMSLTGRVDRQRIRGRQGLPTASEVEIEVASGAGRALQSF